MSVSSVIVDSSSALPALAGGVVGAVLTAFLTGRRERSKARYERRKEAYVALMVAIAPIDQRHSERTWDSIDNAAQLRAALILVRTFGSTTMKTICASATSAIGNEKLVRLPEFRQVSRQVSLELEHRGVRQRLGERFFRGRARSLDWKHSRG